MIGETLAHYEILEQIGQGGMGTVYRARDTKLDRDVALKFLPPDFAFDPERVARFEREAKTLASLNHANIAGIHGFEEDGERRFLVMELVEGEDLSGKLSRGAIPPSEALDIARQIADGLVEAHERGIVHRDLKPANVRITSDGKVKILDFGLARAYEGGGVNEDNLSDSPTITAMTQVGVILGTAAYMSPEQAKGKPVDHRADLWALGVVLWEMLTGKRLFQGEDTSETLAAVLREEPSWEALPNDLPPMVVWLIRCCLKKDPRQRLHAAADSRIMLEEATEAGVAQSVSPTRLPRFAKLGIALLGVVAFALGGLLFGVALRPPSPEGKVTGDPVRLMIPVREDAAVVPLPESASVAVSPDGRWIVYVVSKTQSTGIRTDADYASTQLYLRPIDSFESTSMDGTAGGSAPFFSPDGRWVGFFDTNNGVLKKVARGGGVPVEICTVSGLSFRSGHWADDGAIYYSDHQSIFAVHENGGEPRPLAVPDLEAGEKTFRFPTLLPGSQTILFMRGLSTIPTYDDADIALFDLDSGEVRVLVTGGLHPRYVATGHILYGRRDKVFALPFDADRLETTGPAVEVLEGVVTSEGYGTLQFACSEEGTVVYVAGGPEQYATELMILDRSGEVERLPQAPRPYGGAKISPDANSLIVSVLGANANLWVYELQRGTMTLLVSGWDNFSGVWNPSGDEIAFGSNRGGQSGLWTISTHGSGSPTRLVEDVPNLYPTCWSPDGERVFYSGQSPGTGMDVWSVDRQGTSTAVVVTDARESGGVLSPDGEYMAYTSDESGQIEVYVREQRETGRRWKLSEDGGDLPLWSREGNEIYYWSGSRLMIVALQAAPEFRPTRAKLLLEADFEVHDFDVFPGGDRFLVVGRSSTRGQGGGAVSRRGANRRLFPAQTPDLRVVLNWFGEVERLAPSE